MRTKSKEKTGRKKGKVASKMPKIEFDKNAIEEIKSRKKGLYKKWVKQPKVREGK